MTQAAEALSNDELLRIVGQFNDVTEKLQSSHETLRHEVRRLQDELVAANEELERSRRLAGLGQVAAGIAHEVRNPLGSIRLFAGMLKTDLADQPDTQQNAVKILRAVEGLDAVVCDVLTFAKELRVRPIAFDPADLIEAAIEACMTEDARRITIDRAYTRSNVNELNADPSLLKPALVNVIRNAFESMLEVPEDQRTEQPMLRVDLNRRRRRIGGSTGPVDAAMNSAAGVLRETICLSFEDSGPGFPTEALERVFNPFFTTREAGTGLGLAIVNRIVDANKGSVRIGNRKTENGRITGAIVELIFPIETSQDGETSGERSAV